MSAPANSPPSVMVCVDRILCHSTGIVVIGTRPTGSACTDLLTHYVHIPPARPRQKYHSRHGIIPINIPDSERVSNAHRTCASTHFVPAGDQVLFYCTGIIEGLGRHSLVVCLLLSGCLLRRPSLVCSAVCHIVGCRL